MAQKQKWDWTSAISLEQDQIQDPISNSVSAFTLKIKGRELALCRCTSCRKWLLDLQTAYIVPDIVSVTDLPGNVGCRLTGLRWSFTDHKPRGHLRLRPSRRVLGEQDILRMCIRGVFVFWSKLWVTPFICPKGRGALNRTRSWMHVFGRSPFKTVQCLSRAPKEWAKTIGAIWAHFSQKRRL